MKKEVVFAVCFAIFAFIFILNGCAASIPQYGEEELVEELKSRPKWVSHPPACEIDKCFAVGVAERMELQVMALASAETEARRVMASGISMAVNSILKEAINRKRVARVEDLGWLFQYINEAAISLNIGAPREDYYLARYKVHEGERVRYYWTAWVLISATKTEMERVRTLLEESLGNKLREENIKGAEDLLKEIREKFFYQGLPGRQ